MQLQQGVQLHFIKTKKFKDIGVSIRFRNKLSETTSASRSLLALMLCDRSTKYDTKKKMGDYLDTLYGATLNAQTAGYGSSQVIELRSKVVNPSYLKDGEQILQSLFSFLHEIVMSPLLTQEVFDESKSILAAKIDRMQDEPSQYAISQGLKLAGKGTPLATSALGERSDLEKLTLEDVKLAYESMIKNDRIDIILCGDVQEQEIETIIKQELKFEDRELECDTYYKVENDLKNETVTEYKNISQSNIMMVWFTNTQVVDVDYYALRVANAMFGQYSTSLLFQEVREKNSLCYSVFSNLISYDGALAVTTGVEKENITKTIDLVKLQFDKLCNGEFQDTLLDVSKTMVINSLKASKDNMNSLIALQYQNNILGYSRTNEDIILEIEKITKEDIIAVMNKCVSKMTFILTKEEEHVEN